MCGRELPLWFCDGGRSTDHTIDDGYSRNQIQKAERRKGGGGAALPKRRSPLRVIGV